MSNDLQTAFNKAKINLMSRADSAFFTTVCFSLKHAWDNTCKTAWVDGINMRINPDFFMSLHPEERVFLLIHESMHVAFLHMDRLQSRDLPKWNVAADHVINLMLIARGFKMPKIGLADRQYIDLSTEQVYALLPAQDKAQVDMDIQSCDTPPEELKSAIQDILIRASIQSKIQGDKPGTIPGEIEVFLNGLLNPKLPWQRILQKFVQALFKNDYTFRKPNRRYFPEHYLPSLFGEKLMDLAIAVDISGSVSDADFHHFVSEVASIFKMMKPDKITLIKFESRITSVDTIKNMTDLRNIKFKGRGGTCIEPVIDWANANKPKLLLVFSDGYFNFMGAVTKVNTLWLIHENDRFQAPFGKVINYEMGETINA